MSAVCQTDSASLEKEARRIIDLLKDQFRLNDGGFAIDRDNGRLTEHHTFHDLGDFVPFLLYFDEKELAASQVRLFAQVAPSGVLVSEYPTMRVFHGFAKAYEYTDLLLGLISYHQVVQSDESRRILQDTADAAIRIFSLDRRPNSFYSTTIRAGAPVVDARMSTLIECFLDMWRLTNDERYVHVARTIYDTLTAIPFYKEYGIFPDFAVTGALEGIGPRGGPWRSGALHKSTTNTLYSFLELFRVTKDRRILRSIETIVSAVRSRATAPGGAITTRFDPIHPNAEPNLGSSFSIIDFLCDFYTEQKREDDIAFARSIADYWLSEQSKHGLFPFIGGTALSHIDSETDMIVALHKLYEVTGDHMYEAAALKCLSGMLLMHGSHDYPLAVNIHTGAVSNPRQRTKFVCLSLKALILRIEYERGARIYASAPLFELLKDR